MQKVLKNNIFVNITKKRGGLHCGIVVGTHSATTYILHIYTYEISVFHDTCVIIQQLDYSPASSGPWTGPIFKIRPWNKCIIFSAYSQVLNQLFNIQTLKYYIWIWITVLRHPVDQTNLIQIKLGMLGNRLYVLTIYRGGYLINTFLRPLSQ